MENESFQLNTAAIEAEAIHFVYSFQVRTEPNSITIVEEIGFLSRDS
jgi:hypothetical protein